ncbi:hypothetical protein BpHYR1_004634, partial [Brachionus plicatilis]
QTTYQCLVKKPQFWGGTEGAQPPPKAKIYVSIFFMKEEYIIWNIFILFSNDILRFKHRYALIRTPRSRSLSDHGDF